MIFILLSHQWKRFWRGGGAGQGVAVRILIGIIVLYLMAVVFFVGISLPHFLHRLMPGQDITRVFCGFILYYFSVDIIMRLTFQDLPTLSVQPYLLQNIRRRELVRFLNIRSLFHFFNLLPMLLFIPFSVRVIGAQYGAGATAAFLVSILSLTTFNHFLILYIKRKITINTWWQLGFVAVVVAVAAIFSIRNASAGLFLPFLSNPWLCLAPVVLAVAAFLNNSFFLRRHLYLEQSARSSRQRPVSDYSWLQKFGAAGNLMALDLKLIFRNKRTRAMVFFSLLVFFYGFIFYKKQYIANDKFSMIMLGSLFITGTFITNYGNSLFAWQSGHFDLLMTDNINVRTYIKSKFMLFTLVSTLLLIVASLYGLLSWKILPLQVAMYFYNVGINTVIAVWFAMFTNKGIVLDKGAAFTSQGISTSQWAYGLVIMLVPFGIYALCTFFFNPWTGIAVLGVMGLISLLLQNWWIGILTSLFAKRKYLILEGFRKK